LYNFFLLSLAVKGKFETGQGKGKGRARQGRAIKNKKK
jgi:hypothetical protein